MTLAARMDEMGGRGGWIAATVLGFILYWPVGLAFLIYLALSGRLRSWRYGGPGRWYNQPARGGQVWNQGQNQGHRSGCGWNWGGWSGYATRPSGNQAFDDYRTETIRRLEEEQREFVEYLERLRRAKDKSEFDEFMAERRRRTTPPDAPAADDTAA